MAGQIYNNWEGTSYEGCHQIPYHGDGGSLGRDGFELESVRELRYNEHGYYEADTCRIYPTGLVGAVPASGLGKFEQAYYDTKSCMDVEETSVPVGKAVY